MTIVGFGCTGGEAVVGLIGTSEPESARLRLGVLAPNGLNPSGVEGEKKGELSRSLLGSDPAWSRPRRDLAGEGDAIGYDSCRRVGLRALLDDPSPLSKEPLLLTKLGALEDPLYFSLVSFSFEFLISSPGISGNSDL